MVDRHTYARVTGQEQETEGPGPEEFEIDDSHYDPELPSIGGSKQKPWPKKPRRPQETRVLAIFVAILSALGLFVLLGFAVFSAGGSESRDAGAAAPTGLDKNENFVPQQNWGSYSPYFDSGSHFDAISPKAQFDEFTLPPTCEFRQVHVLHRHGDRYPSGGTYDTITKAAKSLAEMTEPPHESLAWLRTWNLTLGQELLVSKGVGTLFASGAQFWGSHGRFLYNATSSTAWSKDLNVYENGTERPLPVLRATDQERIQDSARAWAAGFFGTYGYPSSGVDPSEQYNLVLQSESAGTNNSLASYFGCPNAGKKGAENGGKRKWKWVKIYLEDAAKRLQQLLPGYKDFGPVDALAFQDLCAFETAAYGSSAFCQLFTSKEWRGFEYHFDVNFYGDAGWGGYTGPATGLPYLQELHARLTGQLIKDPLNGVNTTLDSDPATFPLAQPFYLDMTHDTVIFSVLSALQFDWIKEKLPSHKIKIPRQTIVSRLTPFGARLYIEVLGCSDDKYVRLKLNNRILPLGSLSDCPSDPKGLCPLKGFINSLETALKAIDFVDVCYGEHEYKFEE